LLTFECNKGGKEKKKSRNMLWKRRTEHIPCETDKKTSLAKSSRLLPLRKKKKKKKKEKKRNNLLVDPVRTKCF
jgi:hypothetical protein